MKIMQEIARIGVSQVTSCARFKIKKYHISRKGTARKNKSWDWYMKGFNTQPVTIWKGEVEVERVIE